MTGSLEPGKKTANHEGGRTIWVVRAGRDGRYLEDFEARSVVGVALPGVGDVTDCARERIMAEVPQRLAEPPERGKSYAAMLARFVCDIECGDRVVTPDPTHDEFLLGTIVGDYQFVADAGELQHVREVQWNARVARGGLPRDVIQTVGAPLAVFKPGNQPALASIHGWPEQ